MAYNYYKDQFDKLQRGGKYPFTFKVQDDAGETNWLQLNEDSAKELLNFIKEIFPKLVQELEKP